MPESGLFWVYLLNVVLLIVHEMDSAYWKEWELFHLPGGPGFFMLLHIPLLGLAIYGWLLIYQQTTAGLIFSLVVSLIGVGAFCIHSYFLQRGHAQFNTRVSRGILWAILIVSIVQGLLTGMKLIR